MSDYLKICKACKGLGADETHYGEQPCNACEGQGAVPFDLDAALAKAHAEGEREGTTTGMKKSAALCRALAKTWDGFHAVGSHQLNEAADRIDGALDV